MNQFRSRARARFGTMTLILILSTTVGIVIGVNFVEKRIYSTGIIITPTPGLEIYWNQNLTNPVSNVSWGTLWPGNQKTITLYISNTGNMPLTLNMTTQGWTPQEASNYISVTWTAENTVIPDGGVLQANVTLAVSSSITGISDFSLDIVIAGSG